MLHHLHLTNVGPAPTMRMDLAPRLNLVTGDNGLGKSFLLDVAWWALTRRWPFEINHKMTSGYMARPRTPGTRASIELRVESKKGNVSYTSHYNPKEEAWTGKAGRPWNPGLVIYAHADGAFSVWDPARNYWKKRADIDVQDRLPGYVFTPREVWDELRVEIDGRETIVCNGLVRDWASWIRERGEEAELMERVLADLSPSQDPGDILRPGPLTRVSIDDPRDIPSLVTAYANEVPILHASSGVRRIVALAYMLLWSWREHSIAATRTGEPRTSRVVMLIDEIEAHLHPRWQRSILRSVLKLASLLHKDATIQLIAATHSPLVLASAEPMFDPAQDAWFDLDLETTKGAGFAQLRRRKFARLGDASAWLRSVAFDLKEAVSLEAEEAISAALRLASAASKPSKSEVAAVERKLQDSLGETDRFWMRWEQFKSSLNGAGKQRA